MRGSRKVNAINSKTIQTGVTAWTTEQGALRLKSDGRGIKIDPYDTTDPEIVSKENSPVFENVYNLILISSR